MLNCWKHIRGVAVAVFAAGLALTAAAADTGGGKAAPAATPQVSAKAPAAPAAVIVRDTRTGQLRAATAQEIKALAAEVDRLLDRGTAVEKPLRMPGGATAYSLTDNYTNVVVARRNADGKIETACFDDATPAKKFMGLSPDGVPSTPAKVEEK